MVRGIRCIQQTNCCWKTMATWLVEAGKSKSATLALDILPGGMEGATYAVAVSAVAMRERKNIRTTRPLFIW